MGDSSMAGKASVKRPPEPLRKSSRKKAKVDYKEKSESDLNVSENAIEVTKTCTPVKRYRELLIKQKKELYKDPPALPPEAVVLKGTAKAPQRSASGEYVFSDYASFRPNISPSEVLQAGGFGGTYFRSIES